MVIIEFYLLLTVQLVDGCLGGCRVGMGVEWGLGVGWGLGLGGGQVGGYLSKV